ncbi:MAG: pitrilysin family protein [Firmicutes bacterium]|nr:pitrilysin family protein [Bacillota bacterium]
MDKIIKKENSFIGEKYTLVKHKSGLDIYVFPKDLTTYYALFATKYGSIDNCFKAEGDTEYTRVPDGIAHYLEHKMFENADGVDTFARFAKTGADANAYTSFNITGYLFSCTDNFYESLDILLDYVTSPYFTPETVQKEQGIIGQEIRMGEDNPGRELLFGLLESLYEKHTVRNKIAGTVESISHITSDLLYKCYNTFYNLGNMALCVCGKVDVDKVIESADRVLTKSRPAFKVESVYAKEKPEVFCERSSKKMQVAKPLFGIGVKDVDISADPRERMKKKAAMNIISDVLFGKTSKFYNDLYNDGLISPSFSYWFEHNKCYSFLTVSGDSDDPEKVYGRFKEYTADVLENGIDKEACERSRRVMYSSMIKSFDSTEEIANNLISSFAFDDAEIFDFVDIIKEIDIEYITELLRRLFVESHYAIMTVMPLDEA